MFDPKQTTYPDVRGARWHTTASRTRPTPCLGARPPQVLKLFWSSHDPTTPNRQGPDVGSQYRSAIFFHSEEQRRVAEETMAAEQGRRGRQIVTEIKPAPTFWEAEEYHQDYINKKNKSRGGGCVLC